MKRFIHQAARAGIPPFPAVTRAMRRVRLRQRIAVGDYVPMPPQVCHFPDYERPALGEAIPRTFHHTWKDGDLPEFFRACKKTIERLHPAPLWEHRLWTDSDIELFVKEHFPHRVEAFDAMPHMIMKVDTFRYMLLSVHGGVYSDLDVVMYKPIDALLADCRLFLPAESDLVDCDHLVAQHFMASVPGHPFWEDLIEDILGRPLEEIRAWTNPLSTTGPTAVTRVWRASAPRYAAKIPHLVYANLPPEYHRNTLAIPEEAFALHACTGVWR